MKKVLVIGATGMQGSHVIPLLLNKGYQVDGVSIDDACSTNENLRYIKADAYNIDFLKDILKNQYDGIIDFLHYSNVENFKKKVPLFLENTKHYIFLSSYRAYADNKGILTEDSPRLTDVYANDEDLMQNDTYGVSKCRCEDILRQSGYKNYTIVRPVVVYAEQCVLLITWKGRVIPLRAKQGGKLLLPIEAREQHASIIYAGDIARLYAELLFNEKAFEQAYTLGAQEPITWGQMAEIYQELCGITCEWIPGEEFAKMAMGNTEKISASMKFMLYYDRFFNRNVNVDKVLEATGIKAESYMSHKDGLNKCIFVDEKIYPATPYDIKQLEYMDEYIQKKRDE